MLVILATSFIVSEKSSFPSKSLSEMEEKSTGAFVELVLVGVAGESVKGGVPHDVLLLLQSSIVESVMPVLERVWLCIEGGAVVGMDEDVDDEDAAPVKPLRWL